LIGGLLGVLAALSVADSGPSQAFASWPSDSSPDPSATTLTDSAQHEQALPRILDARSAPSRTTTVRGARRHAASVGQAERVLAGSELLAAKGGSLAEALERIPGVSSLKTGTVAKPMVNGLHSQRVVVVEDGIRLEGQSWGAEHAVESDPSRADRISVVQGGASVRYGQGAVGGVVVLDPAPLDHVRTGGEWAGSLRSNGRQAGSSLRLSGPLPGHPAWAWGGSLALRASGDRSHPDGVLPNTALREGSWSAAVEHAGEHLAVQISHAVFWQHQGILSSSHIGNLTDLRTALAIGSPPDTATWRWSVGRPDQSVRHDVSRLRLQGDHDTWRWCALVGWQDDRRREWDLHKPINSGLAALDRPELDYNLRTGTLDLEAEPRLDGIWQWRTGLQGTHQENEYGGRAFVPNFRAVGGGAWSVLALRRASWSMDAGLRADLQGLDTWRRVAGEIVHRERSWVAPSWSLGWSWRPAERWTWRAGLSSGWRAPSAVELHADGLHHGVAAIERGDSTLRRERSVTAQTSLSAKTEFVELHLAAWATRIEDFVHLRPEASPRLTIRGAFPSFVYTASNAWLAGSDVSATVPLGRSCEALVSGSAILTRDGGGDPIPFSPASRLRSGVDWIPSRSPGRLLRIGPRVEWIAATDPVPDDYAPPPGQALLLGMEGVAEFGPWKVSLRGSNLANAAWRDPSDRLRYFAPQPGIDIGANVALRF
jgi:iron complex outermembrane recepter protein